MGRKCLCNALMANIGLGQLRKDGYQEQPAIHPGRQDLDGARALPTALYPGGWTARAVAVDWLLSPTHHPLVASSRGPHAVPR